MGGRGASGRGGGGGGGGGGGRLTDAEKRYLERHAGSNPITVGGKELYVPQWIQRREGGLYGGLHVVRETEKAVLVKTSDVAQTGTTQQAWVPKSTLLTRKQYAQKGVEEDKRWLERGREKKKKSSK